MLVDALVTAGSVGDTARAELRGRHRIHAPAIFRAEAVSALRGLVLRRELAAERAATALADVRTTLVRTYPFEPFTDRVWQLHDNLTVYDAWYVALAETLGVPLVTADERVQRVPGLQCEVRAPGDAGKG